MDKETLKDEKEVMSSEDKKDFDYVMESLFRIYHSRLGKNGHQERADIRSIRVIIDQLLELDEIVENLFRLYYNRLGGKNGCQKKKADVKPIRAIIDQLLQLDESIVFTGERTERYSGVVAWAQDFVKAASERSGLLRILLRFCLGRYAFREFLGMVEALQKIDYINSDLRDVNYPRYDCENQEYHSDPVPLDWLNTMVKTDKILQKEEINDKNL